MRRIKVLIVEDSLLFRELLVKGLMTDPFLEVVATASNPYEARDCIINYSPDVMTLDVNLPRMSGIDFLRKLIPQYPIPTVVISSLNDSVFDALSAGAVDFVNKPCNLNSSELGNFIKRELITKIKIASTVKVGNLKKTNSDAYFNHGKVGEHEKVIAIGASTGGTEAIFDVVKQFDRDIPGVVVVQHMPPGFTKMYAQRLNNQCRVLVKEAKTGDRVLRGEVLIAPGDSHLRLVSVNGNYQVVCSKGEKVSGHCPSVDVLFESVAKTVGDKAIGVILTGMGADGAKGLKKMYDSGAYTIGQNESSCIVYGMPKVAYEIGGVKYQVALQDVTRTIYSILEKN